MADEGGAEEQDLTAEQEQEQGFAEADEAQI